ncbi:MAG: TetR/AcrR family transcriptional regulator [Bacteroidota bacterium]
MVPRTQEQFKEIRESRRLQIMETALKLFALEGYGHCTISMLAKEAGISKGLLYNYFESKEALLAAIIENGMNEIMEIFDPNHDGVLTAEEFSAFIHKIFSTIRSHQEYWILFISVIIQPRVKEYLKNETYVLYIETFLTMMVNYFKKRDFKNPILEVFTFSALIEGFGALLIYSYEAFEIPDEIIDQFENRIIEMYA